MPSESNWIAASSGEIGSSSDGWAAIDVRPKAQADYVAGVQAANAAPLVPELVMRTFRRWTHDDAAISRVDDTVRASYLDRLRRG
jgi:hypothetical protein